MTKDISRLHITPLSPDLLPAVLGGALKSAQNVSYHEIQSAAANKYGYVDLPKMEADKVKKRLNGAILKGKKIRIEDAKPRKRKHQEVDPSAGPESNTSDSRTRMRDKKAKGQECVVPGHELAPDRKVERGWTEAKKGRTANKSDGKPDRRKSKYTDKDELLFRTKVPLNKLDVDSDKPKKSRKEGEAQVVHEFENSTTQPSFLKQGRTSAKADLHYVDGQGWVDENGSIVEPEPLNVKTKRQSKQKSGQDRPAQVKRYEQAAEETVTAAEDSSSRDHLPDDDDAVDNPPPEKTEADATSSSSAPSTPASVDDTVTQESNQKELHPLEALFKKPQKPASSQDIAKPSLELSTSNFSFLEGGAEDDIEEDLSAPGTPYSSQDVRNRGLRSAAPTPDTAYPSRFNSYGSSSYQGDDVEDESDKGEPVLPKSSEKVKPSLQTAAKGEPSEFEKMFWEKRGDNNRAWKARRRTVLKEKRQRENRARRPRNW